MSGKGRIGDSNASVETTALSGTRGEQLIRKTGEGRGYTEREREGGKRIPRGIGMRSIASSLMHVVLVLLWVRSESQLEHS